MASDAITIHVPDDLYSRLERLAGLTKQPLEGLIVKTLSANLPALPDELSPTTRDALQMLEGLSDAEVSQRAQATFPQDQYERLTQLRERRHECTLIMEEREELDRLLAAADLLTLEKANTAVLLRWRGHRLPSLAALSTAGT